MDKPKVLILYNQLFHYRIPVWNILAEKCDLTVTYSIKKNNEVIPKCNFKHIYLPAKVIAKRFYIQKENIRKLARKYDVIIAYGDIAWLKFSTLPWFNRQKVIFWSLGVSASYDKGFDQNKGWDKIRKFFYNKADALVFYTQYPIDKYKLMGIEEGKMFVAHNTVKVLPITDAVQKDSILFIGTLYRQKGIQVLLDAYLKLSKDLDLPILRVVGNGPDFKEIQQWIVDNKMTHKICLCGAIYDIQEKAKYFAKALACISPNQAGLSVLESMGYGVPFITSENAITGGEIFNIHNQEDGIIMNNQNELVSIIKDITLNSNKYIEMGKKAKMFYDENRTPQIMSNGLWEAIQYVIKE